jgi:hypothetical protein
MVGAYPYARVQFLYHLGDQYVVDRVDLDLEAFFSGGAVSKGIEPKKIEVQAVGLEFPYGFHKAERGVMALHERRYIRPPGFTFTDEVPVFGHDRELHTGKLGNQLKQLRQVFVRLDIEDDRNLPDDAQDVV